jgi:hypothetical protein
MSLLTSVPRGTEREDVLSSETAGSGRKSVAASCRARGVRRRRFPHAGHVERARAPQVGARASRALGAFVCRS